jgi:DNA-directed RNA polymerase subunit RPC12/RpoP
MHKENLSDRPGMCSKCGKQMEQARLHTGKAMYTCPMHADQTGKKPRKCPVCGMKMTKKV